MTYERFTAKEAVEAFADPDWAEAPLTDGRSPLVVVDLDGHSVHASVSFPRVVVGVGNGGPGAADVVLDDESLLPSIETTCATAPWAAVTLVQLLRAAANLDVGAAFVAESLAYSALLSGPEHAAWLARATRQSATPTSTPVLVGDDGVTLTVTLNRPEVRNAYSAALRDALVDILRAAIVLPDRRVVLRGNGPAFSSGGDLAEFGAAPDPLVAHLVRTTRSPGLLLAALGERASAVVHGPCVGAGVELPAFCASVTARPDATFRLPEVPMGLLPGAGGTVSISRRIGRRRTALLALSAVAVDAETAMRWGLVDQVAD